MHELDFKTIGSKIRERRLSLGITQESIANYLDVNPSHISNIECGRAHPSLAALVEIANILHCSVDTFIHEEYSYSLSLTEQTIDEKINSHLKFADIATKNKFLKIIELL